MEDRRKKPRTQAEEEAVREFRRLLAEMLGEPPPDESEHVQPEAPAPSDEELTEPPNANGAVALGAVTELDGAATDPYEYAEDAADLPSATPFQDEATDVAEDQIDSATASESVTADLSSATPFQDDTTDVAEDQIDSATASESVTADLSSATPLQDEAGDAAQEAKVHSASVSEPEPVSKDTPMTGSSPDREWVRIELKDGRRLEAWRRSSPSTGQQLLILDVVSAFDSHGKEISSNPADSFVYRSEVLAINGSKIHQEHSKASTPVNPSPNDEATIEKERS